MRRVLITTFISGLIILGGLSKGLAQYRFDNWTTDDGLPQNTVSAILQTRDGYLWLATAGGLVRFDGLRFTVFDKGNTKGLTSVRFSISAGFVNVPTRNVSTPALAPSIGEFCRESISERQKPTLS